MAKKTLHVVKSPKGGWALKKGGSSRVTKIYCTQKVAIDRGRKIAKSEKAEFYVHGRDGKYAKKIAMGRTHILQMIKDNSYANQL